MRIDYDTKIDGTEMLDRWLNKGVLVHLVDSGGFHIAATITAVIEKRTGTCYLAFHLPPGRPASLIADKFSYNPGGLFGTWHFIEGGIEESILRLEKAIESLPEPVAVTS